MDIYIKPILTISIPTYNRPDQIKKQVKLLLPQLCENVELVIIDNCSPIPVSELFSESEREQFKIIRNNTNIGGDANIARCFEYCKTKWLWTLSDDDYVSDNCVKLLLEKIRENNQSVFLCFNNYFQFNAIGFRKIINQLSNPDIFIASFTMSMCVYNIFLLKNMLYIYYDSLSSHLGTLILVLKYAENDYNAIFSYLRDTLISEYSKDVGWNYKRFIYESSIFLYFFQNYNQNILRKTLFRGYFLLAYKLILLNRRSSNIKRNERLKLLKFIIKNQGFISTIRENIILLIYTILNIISNDKIGHIVKKHNIKSYFVMRRLRPW